MKYIKKFNSHSDYNSQILPNVSYCEDECDLHYNPFFYELSLSEFFQFINEITLKANKDYFTYRYNGSRAKSTFDIFRGSGDGRFDLYSKLKDSLIRDDNGSLLEGSKTISLEIINEIQAGVMFYYNNEEFSADITSKRPITSLGNNKFKFNTTVELTSAAIDLSEAEFDEIKSILESIFVLLVDATNKTVELKLDNGDGTYSSSNSSVSITEYNTYIRVFPSCTLLNISKYPILNILMDLYIFIIRESDDFKILIDNDWSVFDYDWNNFDGQSWKQTFDLPQEKLDENDVIGYLNGAWENLNAQMTLIYGSNWKQTTELPKLCNYKILIPEDLYKQLNLLSEE